MKRYFKRASKFIEEFEKGRKKGDSHCTAAFFRKEMLKILGPLAKKIIEAQGQTYDGNNENLFLSVHPATQAISREYYQFTWNILASLDLARKAKMIDKNGQIALGKMPLKRRVSDHRFNKPLFIDGFIVNSIECFRNAQIAFEKLQLRRRTSDAGLEIFLNKTKFDSLKKEVCQHPTPEQTKPFPR